MTWFPYCLSYKGVYLFFWLAVLSVILYLSSLETEQYLCKYFSYPILTHDSGKHDDWHNSKNNIGQNIDVRGALRHFTFNALSRMSFNHLLRFIYYLNLYQYFTKHICPYIGQSTGLIIENNIFLTLFYMGSGRYVNTWGGPHCS